MLLSRAHSPLVEEPAGFNQSSLSGCTSSPVPPPGRRGARRAGRRPRIRAVSVPSRDGSGSKRPRPPERPSRTVLRGPRVARQPQAPVTPDHEIRSGRKTLGHGSIVADGSLVHCAPDRASGTAMPGDVVLVSRLHVYAGHLSVRVRPAYDAAQSERSIQDPNLRFPRGGHRDGGRAGGHQRRRLEKWLDETGESRQRTETLSRQGRKRVENGTIGAMCDHQVVHRSGEIVTRSASRLRHIHGGAPVQHAARRDRGVQGKVLWSYGADEYPVRRKDVEAPRQVVAYPEGVTRQDP